MRPLSTRDLYQWAVYGIGSWICFKNVAGYWVVGPVFGTMMLVWRWAAGKNIRERRSVVFFIVSTLVYALVYFVADKFDNLAYAVWAGSALMTLAHALIYRSPGGVSAAAFFYLVLSFHLLAVVE